ncbi:MFS transporter [Streptomyces sp. NBC_01618]|uniref:MFS transporter n=1 Tax=Streptomyces sp. NBC_01618 TaxID=2975900 RepID=UPI003870A37E|nr:MFS transporter [Streptomyces sp. NBC_01618]
MSKPSAVAAPVHGADPKRKAALIVVLFAAFMDLLDSTIVNIAIPSIQRDLGTGYAAIQWVVAAYLLSFAVLLIIGGRLGDMYGRKRLFLVGVASFTVASALCGLVQDPQALIVARALQGASAAMMVPQVLSIITAAFPPKERGAALGAFGGVAGLATVGGPVAGALLINANLFDLGWRIIFLINIPVGIALFISALIVIRESRSEYPIKLDLVGTGLLTVGLLLLLYPLVQGRELSWPTWTFVTLAASVPVLALFALHQKRRSARGGSALIVPDLFRSRSFSAGLIANMVFFGVVIGHFLIFIIFLQTGLGFSVLRAGLTGLPWSFGVSFGAAFSATVLTVKIGRKVMVIGAVLLATGMAGIALTVQLRGDQIGSWSLLPTLLVGGLGMGMIIAPILDFILSDVPPEHAGAGSGVLNASQQVGGAIGIAVIGALFLGFLGGAADEAAKDVTPQLRAGLTKASVTQSRQQEIIGTFARCLTDRTSSTDPAVSPASCRPLDTLDNPRAGAAVGAAADNARRIVFSTALQRTIIAQIGLTALVLLLILLLPRQARHHEDFLLEDETGQVPGQEPTTPSISI